MSAMAEQALTYQDGLGHYVAAVLATPSVPTDRLVLLCHGFLSNKNSTTNKTLTRALLERGIATFRFDFFGQGESEGPFARITLTTALQQVLSALALIHAQGFRRIGLMGSSFGGLVAILTADRYASDGGTLAALGLKCPVPDFPEMLRVEFGEHGMKQWKDAQEIPDVTGGPQPVRLEYAFYEDCLRYDAYKAAEAIRVPTLIVQGDCDEYVPLQQSQRLHDALRGPKRLEVLAGADHRFSRAADFLRMADLLTDWLVQHLTTHPPSPA
jgi:pimeloyl-ACP methyl ester carboxylesterase